WPFPSSPSTTATGFTDESQVGPRGADPPLCGPRGAVRYLVSEPVRARGRGRKPARGHRSVRRVVRPDRLRPVVPPQDEDATMIQRTMTTIAAVIVGGGTSVLACPMCFGAEETSMVGGTKLGVLVLLAVTLVVQGGFLAFFLYLRQRAKRIADIELDTEWSELQGASRTS